ncbi:MAG: ATP-dependent helicase, partial [Patescibacteria group bacterium]
MINYVLKLFRERPNILKKYQQQFKYILVDEFQDTNWAQYDLVKMLAYPANNLTVVADDDQSIYRFRGASMSNVIQFSREFKDAAKVALVRNYRSGQQILDLSYNFIQLNNPNRLEGSAEFSINKKLLGEAKELAQIEHLHCQSGSDEARIVAETILALKKSDKAATWNDFAILVRANSQAQEFEQALHAAGIPHRNSSAAGLYKTRIVADILAFFDALVDYHEGRAIFRLLNLPWLDIAMEDIIKMTHWADRKRISLYTVLLQPQVAGVANEVSLTGLARLRSALEEAQAALNKGQPTEILHKWLLDKGNYVDHLKTLPEADSLEQFRNLRAFWEHLLVIEKGLGDCRVKDVLAVIKQELQSGDEGDLPPDLESGPEMVKLMTVHSAKGLEFTYVFVTNLVDRRFPTIERRDAISIPDALVKEIVPTGDAHLEEERRLFYVAMTRAKRGLFLTSAENYGGVTKKKLSRFLVELNQTTP